MTSIRTIIKYFRRVERVKRLPRDLVTPYDVTQLSDDELLIIRAGAAKDRHGIARLMAEHQVERAAQLIPLLPKYKPPPLSTRIMDWLRRLEGSTASDPANRRLPNAAARDGITRRRVRW